RRIGRSTVEREVTGVVPALHDYRRRKGGVAGVDPWALGVFCIDLSKGALVVEGALNGAHGRIEHARPDVKGVTGDPVVCNDTIAPRSPEGSAVAYPDGPDGAQRVGGNFSDGWSALKGHLAAGTHHLEGREALRRGELLHHGWSVADLRGGQPAERRGLGS